MQTISRARPPGPGWGDGGEPRGRAGCTRGPGPEVTQRSRGHRRQPLALAAIPRVPRPPLSLQRPARPAVPSRVKFPAAGWEPRIRRLQWAPRAPRSAPGTPQSSCPPLPLPPALAGRCRARGPRRPRSPMSAGPGGKGRSSTRLAPRPSRFATSMAPLDRSPTRSSVRPKACGAAERGPLWTGGCRPRPAPPGPPSPALAAARSSALGAEPPPRGHRNFPSALQTLAGGGSDKLTPNAGSPASASGPTQLETKGRPTLLEHFSGRFHFFAVGGCLDLQISDRTAIRS